MLSAVVAAGGPSFPLSEATKWLGNWFPRGTGRIPKISGLSKPFVTLSPEDLSPEGNATGVTAPVGPGQPKASLRGGGVGKELLWGLPQSIVCTSVFVCLSLRSAPLGGEVRLVGGKGERGLSLAVRGREGGWGMVQASSISSPPPTHPPTPTPSLLQLLPSPGALLISPGFAHVRTRIATALKHSPHFLPSEILGHHWRSSRLPCRVWKIRGCAGA